MVNTRTLSIDESVHAAMQRVDHLYCVIAGGKPGGGARWSLTNIDKIEIGRGAWGDGRFVVSKVGRSPLPAGPRRCAFLERV